MLAQLADRMTLYSRGAEVTFLAAFDDSEIAARAELSIDRETGAIVPRPRVPDFWPWRRVPTDATMTLIWFEGRQEDTMPSMEGDVAAEVYAVIEEPVAQGFRARLLRGVSAILGHPIPSTTMPSLVEKQTGKRVTGWHAEASWMSTIRNDLEHMSAEEFRARYVDM